MRAVVQRVLSASVAVAGETVGKIGPGVCVLVGVATGDNERDAERLASKVAALRIFEDAEGKMNLSALDLGYSLLAISQFTLLGDARGGNRPGFSQAMEPSLARVRFETFCAACRKLGLAVETGRFREHMQVALVNNGPVTILLDTQRQF